MSGREVFELQDYLSNQGFLAAPIDGVYGRKTVEAVRLFQKNNGLKADGVFGAGSKNILCGTLVTSVPVATMGNTTPIQNSYIENNPQTSYNNTYSSQVPEGLQQLRASAAAAMEFSLNKMACSNARITLAQANPYLSYDSLYVDGVRCSY
jgi:peptidoglycan hydrolase-like protein with peptidoglycan-binding domain